MTFQDAAEVVQDVPDYLRPGLKLVIVGINPGVRSGAARRHYAFRGNHFWRLRTPSVITALLNVT